MYLITGAGGQLGRALTEEFAGHELVALSHADWDVALPPPPGLGRPDLVLHAAAWTNVDGAEDDPQGAAAVNVGGTANAASLGAPLVYFSTDYVFDGRKREPYLESDGPNPMSAYGRSKLHGEAAAGEQAWIVRSSWLFGPTGNNFVRTMLRLGAEREEVAVVDDLRGSPTYLAISPPRRASCSSGRTASGMPLPPATAPGPTSPRRSSTRPACAAVSAGSRPWSSGVLRRARPTPCSGA